MKIENQGIAIEILNNVVPYPNQMTQFDLSKQGAVYFTWRGTRFKIELEYCSVMEVTNGGHTLQGSDISILMGALIKREVVKRFLEVA